MSKLESIKLNRFEKFDKFNHPVETIRTKDGQIEQKIRREALPEYKLSKPEQQNLQENTESLLQIADKLGKMIKISFVDSNKKEVKYHVGIEDSDQNTRNSQHNNTLKRNITLNKDDKIDLTYPSKIYFTCQKRKDNPHSKFEAIKLSYSYEDQSYRNIFWAKDSNKLYQNAESVNP